MDNDLEDDSHDIFAAKIMEHKYKQVDTASVAKQQVHLNEEQHSLLQKKVVSVWFPVQW